MGRKKRAKKVNQSDEKEELCGETVREIQAIYDPLIVQALKELEHIDSTVPSCRFFNKSYRIDYMVNDFKTQLNGEVVSASVNWVPSYMEVEDISPYLLSQYVLGYKVNHLVFRRQDRVKRRPVVKPFAVLCNSEESKLVPLNDLESLYNRSLLRYFSSKSYVIGSHAVRHLVPLANHVFVNARGKTKQFGKLPYKRQRTKAPQVLRAVYNSTSLSSIDKYAACPMNNKSEKQHVSRKIDESGMKSEVTSPKKMEESSMANQENVPESEDVKPFKRIRLTRNIPRPVFYGR